MSQPSPSEVSHTLIRLHEQVGQVEHALTDVEHCLQSDDAAALDVALAALRQHLAGMGPGRQPLMLTPILRRRMTQCQRRIQGLQTTLAKAQGSVTRLLSQLLPEAVNASAGYGSAFGQSPAMARPRVPGYEP